MASAERQAASDEATEGGVQVGHQHRGRDTLADGVPEHEEQVVACFFAHHYIAVIAADRAQGLVVISDLPTLVAKVPDGQQFTLKTGGKLQVILQGALLR